MDPKLRWQSRPFTRARPEVQVLPGLRRATHAVALSRVSSNGKITILQIENRGPTPRTRSKPGPCRGPAAGLGSVTAALRAFTTHEGVRLRPRGTKLYRQHAAEAHLAERPFRNREAGSSTLPSGSQGERSSQGLPAPGKRLGRFSGWGSRPRLSASTARPCRLNGRTPPLQGGWCRFDPDRGHDVPRPATLPGGGAWRGLQPAMLPRPESGRGLHRRGSDPHSLRNRAAPAAHSGR